MQDLIVSIVQTDIIWKDVSANLSRLDKKINSIIGPTHLIILPEMFNTGFVVTPELLDNYESQRSVDWMTKKAHEKNSVICGSMITKINNVYFNRLYWVLPNGSIETYDKRHLFSLGGEDQHFEGGSTFKIFEYKSWKIKPLICYDLRFPVWSKNTYENKQYAYDLLIYVANWPAARSYAWERLLTARAIENQSYVAGVNRIGKDGRGTPHKGLSGIVEPKGQWISEQVENSESIQSHKLSIESLIDYRNKFTVAPDWDRFTIDF
jgi:omega-amidase